MSSKTATPPAQSMSATTKTTGSCGSCRRRKLRCDRNSNGCSNCVKAQVPCIYPVVPSEKAGKKRGPYQKDKTRREKELEYAIKDMEIKYAEMESLVRRESTDGVSNSILPLSQDAYEAPSAPASVASSNDRSIDSLQDSGACRPSSFDRGGSMPSLRDERANVTPKAVDAPLCDRFWSPFSKDFTQIDQAVNESATIVQKPLAAPSSTSSRLEQSGARQSVVLGASLSAVDLKSLHPSQSEILNYWHIYTLRVEPMTRLLHPPSFSPKLLAASSNPSLVARGTEALMFSIYYAAINAMDASDVQLRFASSKDELLTRFETGVLQALAKANLMASRDLHTLQALVIYLLCLRRQDTDDTLWTLTGLAVRIAQLMDLAAEPRRAKLSPLEIQLRKRLWWTICRLDSRSAEEYGLKPTLPGNLSRDTLPLNVNDIDLDSEATEAPPSRSGFTDMTLPLVGFEIMCLVARLNISNTTDNDETEVQSDIFVAKRFEMVHDCRTELETQYLQYADASRPFDWMTITFTRLMLTKCSLLIYHPLHSAEKKPMSINARNKVFCASIDTIQDSHALKVERRVEQWTWFFRSFVQWHALAYVMAELCHRTDSPDVDRAWKVLDQVLGDRYTINTGTKQSALWQPLHWLLRRAQEVRAQDLSTRASKSTLVSPTGDLGYFDNGLKNTSINSISHNTRTSSAPFTTSNTPTSGSMPSLSSSNSGLDLLDYPFNPVSVASSDLDTNPSVSRSGHFSDPFVFAASDINMQGCDLSDTNTSRSLGDSSLSNFQNFAGTTSQQFTSDMFEQLSSADWMDLARDWTMDI